MYFYDFLAFLLGILALYLSVYYIVSPKSYKDKLFEKHFKHSQTLYKILNIIFSFICGSLLVLSSILNSFNVLEFENDSLVFTATYIILVVIYLASNSIIEAIFVEKNVKVVKIKK